MLEPGYNLQAEMLLNKIKIFDDELKDLDVKIDLLLPSEIEIEQTCISKKDNKMKAL